MSFKQIWSQAVLEKRVGIGWSGLRIVFLFLSILYAGAITLRGWLVTLKLIPATKIPVPVISVGNVTVGGTGKTPLVIYLAKKLAARGKKIGILARGYGKIDETSDDEALTGSTPELKNVIRSTGPDRSATGRKLLADHQVKSIILDDGFQHRRIKRDLDLVTIDCLNPFGHGRLLPAGALREPLSSLYRADCFILTRTDLVDKENLRKIEERLKKFNKPILKSIHQPVKLIPVNHHNGLALTDLPTRKSHAFCGIGNPNGFRKTLEKLKSNPVGMTVFPDHHLYQTSDLDRLNTSARENGAELLITTEKDARRLKKLDQGLPVYALQIELVIVEGENILTELLKNYI